MYNSNEYHYQDKHINLMGESRLRDRDFLKNIVVPTNLHQEGWASCPFNDEIKHILTPQEGKVANVPFGLWEDWRVLTLIKKVKANGSIVYKVALQQKSTEKVLMYFVSTDLPERRKSPSMANGWHVFHADIVAPAFFWNDLKARLA